MHAKYWLVVTLICAVGCSPRQTRRGDSDAESHADVTASVDGADTQDDPPDASPEDTGPDLDAEADASPADASLADAMDAEGSDVAPDTQGPDTVTPDTVTPDTVTPDTVTPDVVDEDTAGPPPCANATLDPGETDVDCGGPCDPCANTKFCKAHADCLSETCIFGICEAPTCTDELLNGKESDVDCGGSCAPCADGALCKAGADCQSSRCTDGVCTSCSDNAKNGPETDVDCGGGCDGCPVGASCAEVSDCDGTLCDNGTCCAANACGACGALPLDLCDGEDNDCDDLVDEDAAKQSAPACPVQAGVCADAVATCDGGWGCTPGTYAAWSALYEAVEVTCDGKDNDCDGDTDETLTNACGACGPPPPEVCNGVDDDCDGTTDEGVTPPAGLDCAGEGVCENASPACLGTGGWGCSAEAAPGFQAVETLCDELDNDCDGETDEAPGCGPCQGWGPVELFAAGTYANVQKNLLGQVHAPTGDLYVAALAGNATTSDVTVRRVTPTGQVTGYDVPPDAMLSGSPPTLAVDPDGVWLAGKEQSKLTAVQLDHALTTVLGSWTGPSTSHPGIMLSGGQIVIAFNGIQLGSFSGGEWAATHSLQSSDLGVTGLTLPFDLAAVRDAPLVVGFGASEPQGNGTNLPVSGLWDLDGGQTVTFHGALDKGLDGLVRDSQGVLHMTYRLGAAFGGMVAYRTWDGETLSAEVVIADSDEGRIHLVGDQPRILFSTADKTIDQAVRESDGAWTNSPFLDPPGSDLWNFWSTVDTAGRVLVVVRKTYTSSITIQAICPDE